jgi:uncharacterized membrane protein YphA (DoxX/SURF4 family)
VVAAAFSTIALALLAASGVSKVIDPDPTRGAMTAAGLPSSLLLSRLLGVLEVVAAVAALTLGGWWAAPSALLYLGFTWFTWAAVRRQIPVQSCGCFGREDTPPTWIHVAYNSVATVALALVVVTGDATVPWSGPLGELALFLGFGLVGGYLSYLLLAQLPRTLRLARTT